MLEVVPHRHVVFTIPKALRGLFQRERRLSGLLTRCAHACVQKMLRQVTGHPHVHAGFSVHMGAPILPDDTHLLEDRACYLRRAPLRMDNVRQQARRVLMRTPPDPLTRATLRDHRLADAS